MTPSERSPEYAVYMSQDVQQEARLEQHPHALLEALDPVALSAIKDRLLANIFYTSPLLKKNYLVYVAETASGKTGVDANLTDSLRNDENVRALEVQEGTHLEQYRINFGTGIACGRRLGLIHSKAGELTPDEYRVASDIMTNLVEVGDRYLPDPAVVKVETIANTAYQDDRGRLKGVDRGWTTARHLVTKRGGMVVNIVTPYSIVDKELRRRERINKAHENEVGKINESVGIIDGRSPQEIKEFTIHTGDRRTREQQDKDVSRNVMRLVRGRQLPSPQSLRRTTSPRVDYLEDTYMPWWMKNLFSTNVAPANGFIVRNSPLPKGATISLYGEKLQDTDLVSNLILQAYTEQDKVLLSMLQSLGAIPL